MPDEKNKLAQLANREGFDRLYFRWLEARAISSKPDVDDSDEAMDAVDEAGRQLLATPVFFDWMIWKWEVLDDYLPVVDDLAGEDVSAYLMALGCIKADLMRLGIAGEE